MRFRERVAIVTGAAGGIGAAVGRLLLSEGARVIAVDLSVDELHSVFPNQAPGLTLIDTDITVTENARSVTEKAIEQHATIDILVNAAGIIGDIALLENQDADRSDRVIEVNVNGTLQMIRHSVPHLRANGGGAIVNLASTASKRGAIGMMPYVVSKHAVIGLTRTAALELAEAMIRVNAVAPGPTDTAMMATIDGWPGGGGEQAHVPDPARQICEAQRGCRSDSILGKRRRGLYHRSGTRRRRRTGRRRRQPRLT